MLSLRCGFHGGSKQTRCKQNTEDRNTEQNQEQRKCELSKHFNQNFEHYSVFGNDICNAVVPKQQSRAHLQPEDRQGGKSAGGRRPFSKVWTTSQSLSVQVWLFPKHSNCCSCRCLFIHSSIQPLLNQAPDKMQSNILTFHDPAGTQRGSLLSLMNSNTHTILVDVSMLELIK